MLAAGAHSDSFPLQCHVAPDSAFRIKDHESRGK